MKIAKGIYIVAVAIVLFMGLMMALCRPVPERELACFIACGWLSVIVLIGTIDFKK